MYLNMVQGALWQFLHMMIVILSFAQIMETWDIVEVIQGEGEKAYGDGIHI